MFELTIAAAISHYGLPNLILNILTLAVLVLLFLDRRRP